MIICSAIAYHCDNRAVPPTELRLPGTHPTCEVIQVGIARQYRLLDGLIDYTSKYSDCFHTHLKFGPKVGRRIEPPGPCKHWHSPDGPG